MDSQSKYQKWIESGKNIVFIAFLLMNMVIKKFHISLPKIIKALNYMTMVFIERIKQLREQCQISQRQLATALEIDQATYCKIDKRERQTKREQVKDEEHEYILL